MRLLIADTLHPVGIEEFRHLGVDVIYEPELDSETLPSAIQNVGILVVRSKLVTARTIEASNRLNLIVRAGHDVANIDVDAASARGIYVASCKRMNAVAVAELALGLIISLDRRIPEAVQSVRAGRWEKGVFSDASGLNGKRLGILGLGAVGREVRRRAEAFGMTVFACSRGLTPVRAKELNVTATKSPKELASKIDILTVHLPLTDRTKGIVSREVLEVLQDGATFINVARSDLVDNEALLELAQAKALRVGLDVYGNSPHPPTGTFAPPPFAPEVVWYGTPHIGSQTQESRRAVAAEAVRIVRSFLVDGMVPNAVNVRTMHGARYQIVLRHYDKVGALANALNVLKRHGINVEELRTNAFERAKAACTRINVAVRPTEQCLQEMAAFSDEVFHVQVVALPIRA